MTEAPLTAHVSAPIDATEERLTAALQERGFGVLTEIDVQGVFKAKLGAEHEPHRILGVCTPGIGKAVLDHDRALATLLPCAVSLRATDSGTEVRVQDPVELFQRMAPDAAPALREVLSEARERLSETVAALG